MSNEEQTVEDRIARLKQAKAKPTSTPTTEEDPAEREQLIVLASRIEAEAVALQEERRRGQAAAREQAERLEHLTKAQGKQLLQGFKQDFDALQSEQQKAFHYWSERLEEATATNRILAKSLILLAAILLGLFAWELFL